MNEDEIMKACPYCGQMLAMDREDARPEMYCRCPGAQEAQAREENTAKMLENLRMLFGEDCSETEPAYRPVDEEIYTLLCEITEKVGREEIGTVSFGLRDGTSGKISVRGIERKKNITRKLG